MVMRIVCALLGIFCTHDEVAAWNSVEEVGHVVTAGRHHHFAIVYFILSHRLNGSLLHHLRHSGIIGTEGQPSKTRTSQVAPIALATPLATSLIRRINFPRCSLP